MNFNELPLIAPILKATREAGYEEPTPIQRETIPLVLEGRDVLGCAQTGTGKTAAFALPILQKLYTEKAEAGRLPRALILTPTRELAIQIQENFMLYGKHLPLKSCVVFGGVSQVGQVEQLRRGVQILIATPGRLNDLIGQGYIHLEQVSVFVLDEADRMLDMGFILDVKRVIAQLPAKRQTLFFSATMPDEVEKLAMSILNDPASVKVDPVSSTVDAIRQTMYMVDKVNKKYLLADLLKKPEVENALVFTRTKHGADRVVRELNGMGVRAMAIHGDKSQNARQMAMGQFKNGELKVLIATDIAARGIDVVGLSHVINYDLPNEPEAYVHRIGRTGRAGLGGDAISFCCIDEMKCLYAIEKLIGRKIPRAESAWPMQVFTETVKEPRPQRPERVARVNVRGESVADKRQDGFRRREAVAGNRRTESAPENRSAQPRRDSRPVSPAGVGEPRRSGFGNQSAAPRTVHGTEGNRAPHREPSGAPRGENRPVRAESRPMHAEFSQPKRETAQPQRRVRKFESR
ncbi:MAG TPA: DEAD/DEAH box helicase [Candidatus Limiplasma sp.]|nr:DEAD/DEAH box helicase [Candidatus Limiplasma sp.]HPS82090.1 DEAD/DEAH box helicase [Candidatus Limiplasma sp.]